METLATFFNDLSTDVVPDVMAMFPDTLDVEIDSTGTKSGGEVPKSGTTTVVAGVPCSPPEASNRSDLGKVADALRSATYYKISFPNYHNGTRIERNPYTRLVVQARGEEPEKTFRPEAWQDVAGLYYECYCTLED